MREHLEIWLLACNLKFRIQNSLFRILPLHFMTSLNCRLVILEASWGVISGTRLAGSIQPPLPLYLQFCCSNFSSLSLNQKTERENTAIKCGEEEGDGLAPQRHSSSPFSSSYFLFLFQCGKQEGGISPGKQGVAVGMLPQVPGGLELALFHCLTTISYT